MKKGAEQPRSLVERAVTSRGIHASLCSSECNQTDAGFSKAREGKLHEKQVLAEDDSAGNVPDEIPIAVN